MKTQATNLRLTFDEHDTPELTLSLKLSKKESYQHVSELRQILDKGKTLSVEIKEYREKRSLDANGYAWVLITKIADLTRASKDDVYIEMLTRYGQREEQLISVVAEAVDMVFRATNNHCVVIAEAELNGKTFKHMAILRGSSTYDSREFSILLDGIISECYDLGIETMTEREKNLLLEEWEIKK